MDYLRGFKVFRDDPDWTNKLLAGTVIGLVMVYIPVVGLVGSILMYGWGALLMRQSVRGQDLPLPPLSFDLDQWTKYLSIGLKPFLVALIWAIPVGLVVGLVLMCGSVSAGAIGASAGGRPGPAFGLCFGASAVMAVVIGLLLGVPAAVAGMRTALTDDFSQGLQFGPVIDFVKANLRELLLGILIIGLIYGVAHGLTCGIGGAILAAPAAAAYAMLMSQLYTRWVQQGGEPLPIAPHDLETAAAGGFGGGGGGGGAGPGAGGQLPPQGGGPYNQPPGGSPPQGGGFGGPPPPPA